MAVRESLDLTEGVTSLPRGRHQMSADEVRSSQRGRILSAMAEVVGEKGYAATTVGDVIGRARVSRNPFYALFADKEDCYLAAYVRVAGQLQDMVLAASVAESDWLGRLRAGLRVYLGAYASAPHYARAFTVELGPAGARVAEHRREVLGRYAELIGAIAEEIRAEDPSVVPVDATLLFGLVGGGDELVLDAVRRGRAARLVELEPTLARFYLRGIAGPEQAALVDP